MTGGKEKKYLSIKKKYYLGHKKLILCFSGTFLENNAGGRHFIFYFIELNAINDVSAYFPEKFKKYYLGHKKLILCFSGTFLENNAGGRHFIFYFIELNAINDVSAYFPEKFSTFSMRTSQSTNKMAANDRQPKLTISDDFHHTENAIKIFHAGG